MDAAAWGQLVEDSDWEALFHALRDLPDGDRETAVKWYRSKGRALARRISERDWRPHSRIVQLELALALAETPEEANKNCQWGRRWVWNDDLEALPACAELLVGRGRDWAQELVSLATAHTFRGDSRNGRVEVTALSSAVVDAFGLPAPVTETWVHGWTTLVSLAHTHARNDRTSPWRPATLLESTDRGVRPAYPLGEDASLEACLRGTREVTTVLCAALDVPDALAEWTDLKDDRWDITETVRTLVGDGTLDRTEVLEATFRSMSRDDRPGTQRVLGRILLGLDPTPAEVRERAALVLHVMPTAHGSMTRILLDLALAAELDDDDLLELGTVVLARKEKAQKTALLAHLKASDSPAREPLLRMAADSDDAAFAAKARDLLGADEGHDDTAVAASGGGTSWSRPVTGFDIADFTPYAGDAAGLDRALSESETWMRITSEAAWLDLVVRLGATDPEVLQAVADAEDSMGWWSSARTRGLLRQWVTTGDPHRGYQRTSTITSHEHGKDPVTRTSTFEWVPPGVVLFTDRLAEETLRRLGTVDELLSTPSRMDGTLTVDDLAARVGRARDTGFAPYDLVQALLRLDLRGVDDASAFEGLSLPPAEVPASGGAAGKESGGGSTWHRLLGRSSGKAEKPGKGTAGALDGVDVIRAWVEAGGPSPRELDLDGARPRLGATTLPLPEPLAGLDGLAEICAPIGHKGSQEPAGLFDSPTLVLGVLPGATEVAVTTTEQRGDLDSVFHAQNLSVLAWSAGPIGPATHHHLARLLAHPREDSRLLAAKHTAEIAAQGRLDPDLLRDGSLTLFDAGDLSLPRAAHGWEQLASLAGLSVVWPAWTAVLDAACRAPRKPAGLADLLRGAREHVAVAAEHVSGDVLPESVREVAAEKGRSKAATEARALVTAADGSGPGPGPGPGPGTGSGSSSGSGEGA